MNIEMNNVLNKKIIKRYYNDYNFTLNNVLKYVKTCNRHQMEIYDDKAHKMLKLLLNEIRHMNKNLLENIFNAQKIIERIIKVTRYYLDSCKNINFQSRINNINESGYLDSSLIQILNYKNEYFYEMSKS
jgi:hypothetical protein